MTTDDQTGSTSNTSVIVELHHMFNDFISHIGECLDEVQQFLTSVDTHLTTIEQACSKEGATTTAAKAMMGRATAVRNLEETKNAMAFASHAFLNSRMADPYSSSTPKSYRKSQTTSSPAQRSKRQLSPPHCQTYQHNQHRQHLRSGNHSSWRCHLLHMMVPQIHWHGSVDSSYYQRAVIHQR